MCAESGGQPATLAAALAAAARRWPDRIAWSFDPGERFTFADVARLTAGYALALRERGVGPGDRVAVMVANEPAFPLTWLALSQLGAAMVPVNTRYQSADAGHVLRACGARVIVAAPEFGPLLGQLGPEVPSVRQVLFTDALAAAVPHVTGAGTAGLHTAGPGTDGPGAGAAVAELTSPELTSPDPAGTANIQFTSGTTGHPKGCVLPHAYWTRLAGGLITEFPYLTERDVMLTAQPFHYIDPQWNVAAGLMAGAELVILDGFHPSSFWAKVREHRVTYFYCLGAMPTLLLRMPPDPADRQHVVRAVQCSAIPLARHHELEQRWGVPWYEAFGMTETGADLRVTDRDHDELVGTGCLGLPVSYRKVRITGADGHPAPPGQTGEITLAGPGMMDGYLGDPEATGRAMRDGWFHTGDLGRMDGDGRVYHTGRIKDMIRRSGENISAREVEEVLATHPAIRLAAVTAVADEIRGEEAKAYYVADGTTGDGTTGHGTTGHDTTGHDTTGNGTTGHGEDDGPAALAEYCLARLAAFKVPRYWQPATDLPRTDSQRVAKARLGEVDGAVFDTVTGEWSDA